MCVFKILQHFNPVKHNLLSFTKVFEYFTLCVLHKAVNSVFIFRFVSNLINIIIIDESHSNANENFKRSL